MPNMAAAHKDVVGSANLCVRGTFPLTIRFAWEPRHSGCIHCEGELMNGLIYLVGLIVVIMAVLSLFGLR